MDKITARQYREWHHYPVDLRWHFIQTRFFGDFFLRGILSRIILSA